LLAEKQKLRYQYGSRAPFRRYFAIAEQAWCDRRNPPAPRPAFDNVVFLGFANSRSAARQFVGHGHITVNGKKVDISSYNVKSGDVVAERPRPQPQPALRAARADAITPVPTGSRSRITARAPSAHSVSRRHRPIVNERSSSNSTRANPRA
jgi:small subunit ribosomal protein S4